MKLVDLSQTIQGDMPKFSDQIPAPIQKPWMSHAQAKDSGNYEDCTCEISEVSFVTSIGTYLDSPFHFDPGGNTIEKLALDQVVMPGIVIDCRPLEENQPISADVLEGIDIGGKAVLFYTGWSQYWGTPKYFRFPFIPEETAQALVKGGAKLAGVDFLAADDIANPRRPAHNALLKNNVLIVENLTNIENLMNAEFIFHAAPVKFQGTAAFPVRAYGVVV